MKIKKVGKKIGATLAKVRTAPGSTSPEGAQVVIHSTLVAERGDEFSVTGFSNLGSIGSVFHQP